MRTKGSRPVTHAFDRSQRKEKNCEYKDDNQEVL
jgi:hypothetical protein